MKAITVRADYMENGQIIPLMYWHGNTIVRIDRIIKHDIHAAVHLFCCRASNQRICLRFENNQWFLENIKE